MAVASPSITQYTIGKGIISIRRSGETNFSPVGNCPTFEFTPAVTKLDHFSSMEGVKTKDKTVVLEKSGTLRIVMEEWTAKNMELALLGSTTVQSGSDEEVSILTESSIRCEVKFTGTNQVGPKWEWYFPGVDLTPSAAISLISDEWANFEITGDVSAVNSSFGTATRFAEGS